jgi:hypothetical protein
VGMAAEVKKEIQLGIAHVLLLDIIGYSNSPLTNNTPELMNSTGLFACPSNSKKLKQPIVS